jgi:hypothetical protein
MATGQVSFHNQKLVKKVLVRVRENPIVNRLNKTRVEKFPDLRAEKEEFLKKKRHDERKMRDQQQTRDKLEKREREQLKWHQDRDADFLDDFM